MMRDKSIWRDKRWTITVLCLGTLLIIGLLAPWIATDGGMIPFGPTDVESTTKAFAPPGYTEQIDGVTKTHFWGTDGIGRDVASRLVHGISVAFSIGIISTLVSLLIPLILGSLSGYVGDHQHKINVWQLILWMVICLVGLHICGENSYTLDDKGHIYLSIQKYLTYASILIIVGAVLHRALSKVKGAVYRVPWDSIVIKMIEIFKSVPKLFLLLAIISLIVRPSMWHIIALIGLLRWPGLTRLIRAEILKVKQEEYVQGAKILGLSHMRILLTHVWPNIYQPIIILLAINIGSAILIESSLSFLGIGLMSDQVSWGQMLSDARQYIPAWWLAIGPGILIFGLIIGFNILSDSLTRYFNIQERK